MTLKPDSIYDLTRAVLCEAQPEQKLSACDKAADAWVKHAYQGHLTHPVPDIPARPDRPVCVSPTEVPRRRLGSAQGRFALLHAVAHIEFNAIDLAADMISRFGPTFDPSETIRAEFITDWLSVMTDEARHFRLIRDRLNDLGGTYGDLPAHNGLWEAAQKTAHCVAERLAIAPMVLEARGLDVTPTMIEKLKNSGDLKSAQCLQIIYEEEVNHVAIGVKWFTFVAKKSKAAPEILFQTIVNKSFNGMLKPPFNHKARQKAGLKSIFYQP